MSTLSTGQLLTAAIAAIIAAVASVLNLVVSSVAQYRADLRKARRETLAPHLLELSENAYAVIARTSGYLESSDPQARSRRREKAREAANSLDSVRRKSRLFLGEISEAIHTLVILPRLAEHVVDSPERKQHLIPLATEVRRALDKCLREAFVDGRFPTPSEESAVKSAAAALREFFSESREWNDDNG